MPLHCRGSCVIYTKKKQKNGGTRGGIMFSDVKSCKISQAILTNVWLKISIFSEQIH